MASQPKQYQVYLAGNPNQGKSTLFNRLTGLQQRTGNYPGVTVEKKSGKMTLKDDPKSYEVNLIDLPGAYSFYPATTDERIVVQQFSNPEQQVPDAVIYLADATHLEKHLLLFTQIQDTGTPIILALNMMDIVAREDIQIDIPALRQMLHAPVIPISARTGAGIDDLKAALLDALKHPSPKVEPMFKVVKDKEMIGELAHIYPAGTDYQKLQVLHHSDWLPGLTAAQRIQVNTTKAAHGFQSLKNQIDETMYRFEHIVPIVKSTVIHPHELDESWSDKLDKVLTHRYLGPLIFIGIMMLVFQAIFDWASLPMDWIDQSFSHLSQQVLGYFPQGSWIGDLLAHGVIPGIGGVLIFVPQIALLFLLIGFLEEVGYMSRVVYLFDHLMKRFGLSGRSIVPLISAGACAIPAVMATRTISSWRERLTTILVTPFISCAARIPVYTVLIGLLVPADRVWGFFNLQGLAFAGLYALGTIAALVASYIISKLVKDDECSYLILELPEYKLPVWRNLWLQVVSKVRIFVLEAGQLILLISMVLWALASYGPGDSMDQARDLTLLQAQEAGFDENKTAESVQSALLEASYAGHLGKAIEPVIRPLGYDWKIGIALLTSFAAREVFVGSISTIYSVGQDADEDSIRERIRTAKRPDGTLSFSPATSWSLLIFYVFAMQCMSTLAVVKRETQSWTWPLLQLVFMTGLAYISAWLVYVILS